MGHAWALRRERECIIYTPTLLHLRLQAPRQTFKHAPRRSRHGEPTRTTVFSPVGRRQDEKKQVANKTKTGLVASEANGSLSSGCLCGTWSPVPADFARTAIALGFLGLVCSLPNLQCQGMLRVGHVARNRRAAPLSDEATLQNQRQPQ